MVNRRAWLRIVEATIAILIIFGVMLVVNSQQRFTQQQDLTRLIVPMLEEISRNTTLREDIVQNGAGSEEELRNFVALRLGQSSIKYDVAVCNSNEICSMPVYPQDAAEIYASERIISSTLEEFSPKKVKIFLWHASS